MANLPTVNRPIDDTVVPEDAGNTVLDLFDNFDDPFTTGQIARFELFDTSLGGGVINVLLFDQEGGGAPLTVQNFLDYVNDDDYVNSIIHRSDPDFVIQGGGFTVDGFVDFSSIQSIPTESPVQNEFSSERSNLRGTIAMAKTSDPDSATSQWFFNLEDNSTSLDNPLNSGGFTVFGEVVSEDDLKTIDAIANLPTPFVNDTSVSSVFRELPVKDPNNQIMNFGDIDSDDDFVRFKDITVSQESELQFQVISNSNSNLVTASINNNQLVLDYVPNQTGTAEITIRANTLLGEFIEDTFSVTVVDNTSKILFTGANSERVDFSSSNEGKNRIYSGKNNDKIFASKSDRVFGGPGDDLLDASKGLGGNRLFGGTGDDELIGGMGDLLLSGDGDDTLDAGKGDNLLIGGDGNDRFQISQVPTTNPSTILDFAGNKDNAIERIIISREIIDNLNDNNLSQFLKQEGNNTIIATPTQDLIILRDIDVNTLGLNNFELID